MSEATDPSAIAKPVPPKGKPKGPSMLHLVITDDEVTVFGQEVDALRFAFSDATPTAARYVKAERGETVKLRP